MVVRLVVIFLFLSLATLGASFYPVAVKLRPFGLDQGQNRSCLATAVVSAYEHAFQRQNFPVKLSLFYLHAAHARHNVDTINHSKIDLALSHKDEKIIDDIGYLLPNYMWPEDAECINEEFAATSRPSVSSLTNIPASFKVYMETKQVHYVFKTGYKNSITIEQIKEFIDTGKIATLALNGKVIYTFNHKTGLIEKTNILKAQKVLFDEANHAVALVGYDDDLYEDYFFSGVKGAFIVRNTWNSDFTRNVVRKRLTPFEKEQFKLFRGKISRDNLPGYYAIPYHFISEIINFSSQKINENVPAFTIVHPTPNYKEFHDSYKTHENNFTTYYAPYSCDKDEAKKALSYYSFLTVELKSRDTNKVVEAIRSLQKLFVSQTNHTKSSYFHVAKLASKSDVVDFYNGHEKYKSFYCKNREVYPSIKEIEDTEFFQSMLEDNDGYRKEHYWDEFYYNLAKKENLNVYENNLYGHAKENALEPIQNNEQPFAEKGIYAVPYACNMQDAKDQIDYYMALLEELISGDENDKEFARQEIKEMINELANNLSETNFNIAYLTSELDVRAFYDSETRFRKSFCDGKNIFPTLRDLENTPFFEKLIRENYQNHQSDEYWQLFLDAFKASFSKASLGKGAFGEHFPEEIINDFPVSDRDICRLSETCQSFHETTRDVRSARKEIKKILGPMINLPAGIYVMGPRPDEPPYLDWTRMRVDIENDFKMAKMSTTQAQFTYAMGIDTHEILEALKQEVDKEFKGYGQRWIGEMLPMMGMTYAEIINYFERINNRLSYLWQKAKFPANFPLLVMRLPTEFEWEYATTTPLKFRESEELPNKERIRVNAVHNVYPGPACEDDDEIRLPVVRAFLLGPREVNNKELIESNRGFKGLSRGVFEITDSPYTFDPREAAKPHETGKIARGSPWDCDGKNTVLRCRSSSRLNMNPYQRGYQTGFRAIACPKK